MRRFVSAPGDLALAVGLVCLLLGSSQRSGAEAADAAAVTEAVTEATEALRIEVAPKIDGRLDEEAWSRAPVVELTQQEPVPRGATPYRTELRVLVTRDAVYFGFRAFDPQPEKIVSRTWERDGELEDDDRVVIGLDTFLDGRTGYWFRISAAGARQDGLVSGPGQASADWDGLWRARVARGEHEWTAEIELPARSLRFGASGVWGMNAARFVARDRTMLRWTALELDADFVDYSRAGRLSGLGDLAQGRGLTVAPYSLARGVRRSEDSAAPSSPRSSSTTGDLGVDVSYNFTPQLGAVLTVNTDFAETEADDRQINLTRFPLFTQEKRSFFLEGSNLFDFALGLDQSFVPFYPRRVGLVEGQRVPILGGVKILGQAGRFSLAALATETDGVDLGERAVAETGLFAGRFTVDLGHGLRFGALATEGDPRGEGSSSLTASDLVWQTSSFRGDKNLALSLWGATSSSGSDDSGDGAAGDRSGWGARAEFPNDRWYAYAQVNTFGEGLDPALGFLPRPGTRQWQGGVAFQPRPSPEGRFRRIRQVFYETFYTRVEDRAGETESWRLFTAPINLTTHSGARLELNWAPQFERLAEPFEVARGVVLPAGSYQFDRFRIEAFTSRIRSWRVGTSAWFGQFYGGQLDEISLETQWAPLSGRLRFDSTATTLRGRLPQGDFTIRLHQLRSSWAFHPDLVVSSFLQYDSESNSVGMNNRLRWTLAPGRDLFAVWTRGWRYGEPGEGFNPRPTSDEVIVKFRTTVLR